MCHYIAFIERISDGTTFVQPFNDIKDLDAFDGDEYHLCDIAFYDE